MIRIALAALAFVASLGAMVFFWQEVRPNQERLLGPDMLLSALRDQRITALAPSGALQVMQRQMLNCADMQFLPEFVFLDPAQKAQVAQICADRAQQILDATPTYSAAWLVRAISLRELGAPDAALAALERARQTGRLEGWIAARRFQIAVFIAFDPELPAGLRAQAQAMAAAEMAVLTSDPSLTDRVVRIYRLLPTAQDWIVSTLETLPPEAQRAFFSRLQRVS